MNVFHIRCAQAVLLASFAAFAHAQDAAPRYPSKPVAIVVPNAPGASFDIFARMYSQKLSDNLGQPFIVDFKPGASGTIASAYVAKSAPDGHVLMIVSPSFTIAPLQYKDLPFDTIKSFAPVSLLTKAPYLVVVTTALPIKSMREYIAYARDNPTALNIATTGAGSFNHLAAEWIHSSTNTQVSYVHYKGGTAYVPDLVSGRVHAVISSITFMKPMITAGKVRPIAVSSITRNPAMPDLATVAEQGVPGYDAVNWVGLVAPAGTPGAIVSRLSTEMAKALKQADVLSALSLDGTQAVGSTPEQFSQALAEELDRWRKLVLGRNIKLTE